MPIPLQVLFTLVLCIILCTIFTTILGFFTHKIQNTSTMANMLVIFGLMTYSTKGVSFGGITTPASPT